MKKFVQEIQIQSYQTNQYAKASVSSLFHFMLEAAWAHAQVMEWGYDDLQQQNMFWVLSRIYLEVEKYPAWQDKIILNTWSAGTDGVYAYREFLLETPSGELVAKGNSAWLILDTENHKIVMLRNLRETFPRLEGVSVCRMPKRIKANQHPDDMTFLPVRFSELDINKHFNSVKYLERVLDRLGVDFLNGNEPAQLEINYLKEGLAGDLLAVVTEKTSENQTLSTIVRESDQADLCTLEIHWRERNI